MTENNENEYICTKGDKETVLRRCDNVHTMTLFCPIKDEGVSVLLEYMMEDISESYMSKENVFEEIPIIDMYACFMNVIDFCKENKIDIDILYSMMGILQSFKNLKYISLEFTENDKLVNFYHLLKGTDSSRVHEVIQQIYIIDVIELVLNNMFTWNIIEMINKILMIDEIIPNSYLEREFLITFYYDEYISFMQMIANNNGIELERLDKNILDYLLLFPKIISMNKPIVRLITNYEEL